MSAATSPIKRRRLVAPPPGETQTTLPRVDNFAFMGGALGFSCKQLQLPVDSEYVPPFGSVPGFEPVRNGPALLLCAGMGRGKSFQFREYMKRIFVEMPGSRVLLISANILYGCNLAAELKKELDGVRVGFYKDNG